jgi:hypothetical protein
MKIELTLKTGELETLLTSLEYSKQRVRDAQETPNQVRQEKLARLDSVAAKLREAKAGSRE